MRPLRAVNTVPDDDADLMGRVKAGDPAGAEGLFSRYAGPILGFTERMLGSRAEAEEVTQDVFLKMITRCEQYDGRASVSTWLFAIAANACRDRLRSAW
ncbi:partial ECF RNA polymerase sigma factor SigW, partial [Gammaproteobacteria bacterium]